MTAFPSNEACVHDRLSTTIVASNDLLEISVCEYGFALVCPRRFLDSRFFSLLSILLRSCTLLKYNRSRAPPNHVWL